MGGAPTTSNCTGSSRSRTSSSSIRICLGIDGPQLCLLIDSDIKVDLMHTRAEATEIGDGDDIFGGKPAPRLLLGAQPDTGRGGVVVGDDETARLMTPIRWRVEVSFSGGFPRLATIQTVSASTTPARAKSG
jgi:hypothetical protein